MVSLFTLIRCSLCISLTPAIDYRFVLNDTYRSELCLLYPPHLIATASIYLAFSLHFPPNLLNTVKSGTPTKTHGNAVVNRNADTGEPDAKRVRGSSFSSTTQANLLASSNNFSNNGGVTGLTPNTSVSASMPNSPLSGDPPAIAPKPPLSTAPRGTTDPITFLASLNVQLPLVLEIVQEILSLYALWKAYEEPPSQQHSSTSTGVGQNGTPATGSMDKLDIPSGQITPLIGTSGGQAPIPSPNRLMQALAPTLGGGFPGLGGGGAGAGGNGSGGGRGIGGNQQSGTGDDRAIQILNRMRMNRDMDLAHPANAGASNSGKGK